VSPPNNSLERTRLACGKLESLLLAKWRENESAVARAAGRLSSRPLGGFEVSGVAMAFPAGA
jgi:hypothetical protein